MNTKAEVLKVLPGDGWSARYRQDEDTFSFDPVVCFLVLRYGSGRIEIVGLVPEGPTFKKATSWNNFDGFARAS